MKVRIRHTVLGKVRFVSHRDMTRVWERALRRVSLPVAYSEGFSPRPRLHFGLARSVGHESVAEYLDVDLTRPVDLDDLPARLGEALPEGVDVSGLAVVDDRVEALQASVTSVTWSIGLPGTDPAALAVAVDDLMAADHRTLAVHRKGKPTELDVRPLVLGLLAEAAAPTGAALQAELVTRGRSVRPAELLATLVPPGTAARVRREEQWMEIDGVRRPPVPADPSRTPALVG